MRFPKSPVHDVQPRTPQTPAEVAAGNIVRAAKEVWLQGYATGDYQPNAVKPKDAEQLRAAFTDPHQSDYGPRMQQRLAGAWDKALAEQFARLSPETQLMVFAAYGLVNPDPSRLSLWAPFAQSLNLLAATAGAEGWQAEPVAVRTNVALGKVDSAGPFAL